MLTAKTLKLYKEQLYKEQNGLCSFCGLPLDGIQSSHLDHDHALNGPNAGRCRGLAHRGCNLLDGTMEYHFNRSGMKSKIKYIDWIKRYVAYLEEDKSSKPIHPNYLNDKVKAFSRLSATDMKKYGFTGTRENMVEEYRKRLKEELMGA